MTILQHYWTLRKFGERGLAAGPACGEDRAHPILIINYVNLQRCLLILMFNGLRTKVGCNVKK